MEEEKNMQKKTVKNTSVDIKMDFGGERKRNVGT